MDYLDKLLEAPYKKGGESHWLKDFNFELSPEELANRQAHGPRNVTPEESAAGKDRVTGKFVAGNTMGWAPGNAGRPRGSRAKMTQMMLDRVAARSEAGLSMEEILLDIAQDPAQPVELRLKAASKIVDIVYPKASSVEVSMDEETILTGAQIDQRLKELLQQV